MEIILFSRPLKASEILRLIDGECDLSASIGGDEVIRGCADLREGASRALGFMVNVNSTEKRPLANCFILTEQKQIFPKDNNHYVVVSDAKAAFIKLLDVISRAVGFQDMRASMVISPEACIHPSAIIEAEVDIGPRSIISAGCVIRRGTRIGSDTVIQENVVVGNEGITVYRSKSGELLRFPHLAGVYIGDNTHIGAGCVIPKGMLSSTKIGCNVIIGNLCNIGHGVVVEDRVWMSVGGLIGGHVHIKEAATLGLGVRVRDNIVIGKCSSIGMGSVVVKSVGDGISVFGNPAKRIPHLNSGPER